MSPTNKHPQQRISTILEQVTLTIQTNKRRNKEDKINAKITTETKNINQSKTEFKKEMEISAINWDQQKKQSLSQGNKLHSRNHENFIQLQRRIEDPIRLKSNPSRNVINLS